MVLRCVCIGAECFMLAPLSPIGLVPRRSLFRLALTPHALRPSTKRLFSRAPPPPFSPSSSSVDAQTAAR